LIDRSVNNEFHLGTLMANFETIELEIHEGCAILRLNRPDRLNSFNAQMHQDVKNALDILEAGQRDGAIRAVLLTGAGRGFCAGQDLSDRNVGAGDAAPDLGASVEKNYKPLVMRIRALDLPVVAAVNGVAAGAGANIAFACDLVFAAKSASFIQSFSKLGLIPDTGGSWILPRMIGPARAMGLALLGEKLSADQAEQWGLIWKSVEDEKLLEVAMQCVKQLACGPTVGYAKTKKAIWESSTNTFEAQLNLERDLMTACGKTADYREGVAAFIEKRPAVFKGQ
jgi:2-(1,2-epoxy-1,2-dihydrophenyl)acetyl-CoA isomerase